MAHPTMDDATPRSVVLGPVPKQAEQAVRSKPVSTIASASAPALHEFPSWLLPIVNKDVEVKAK